MRLFFTGPLTSTLCCKKQCKKLISFLNTFHSFISCKKFQHFSHRRSQDFWLGGKPQIICNDVFKNCLKHFLWDKDITEWKIRSRGLCLASNQDFAKGRRGLKLKVKKCKWLKTKSARILKIVPFMINFSNIVMKHPCGSC